MAKSKPKMDKDHALLIADAEAICKRTEKNWLALKEETAAAKKTFKQAVDNLRHLAEEVTEKGLYAEKDRK